MVLSAGGVKKEEDVQGTSKGEETRRLHRNTFLFVGLL